MAKLIHIVLFVGLLGSTLTAKSIEIDTLAVRDGNLYVSYHVANLLDEKSIQVINRGIISEVVHHIQLWRHRTFLSPVEREHFYSVKVMYDNWRKKYKLVSKNEERLTPQLENVVQKCSVLEDVKIASVTELDFDSEYYLTIDIEFRPLSAESYNMLSDIFQEDQDGKREAENRDKGGVMSVMMNILGFGDKTFSYKTPTFKLPESGRIRF